MGLGFGISSSSNDKKLSSCIGSRGLNSSSYLDEKIIDNTISNNLPNPDPLNYQISEYHTIGKYLIIKIHYLDCKNYEGNKIMVYENCTLKQLLKQKYIDPHFCDNKKYHSPIARFVPTKIGWKMALNFCLMLTNDKV